jgi:hypothetical protein
MESSSERVAGPWTEIPQAARIERWENVLRVLRALPEHERQKHWDMSIWGEKTECGTVACAAGHCGLDPWFRARGFELSFRESMRVPGAWIESLDSVTVEMFFGEDGTGAIFLKSHPRPVEDVISEVEDYLAELKDEDNG